MVTASVPFVGVGTVTVPVKVGEASGAKPEIEAPEGIVTVPVKVGLARFAFNASAVVTKAVVATLVELSKAV